MTFKEIIESYGKELSYNCTINSPLSVKYADITDEHIVSVNPHFDGALYTSVMRCLDIVLKGDHRAVQKGYRIRNNKFTAKKDGNKKTINYGLFIVAEAPEYDEGADTTKFICYDLMYTTMQEYKLKVAFPITLKAYLELIAETCGFPIANIEDLRNGTMQITSEQYLNVANDTGSSYLYRDVLDDIARCAGCSFAFKSDANGDTVDELYIIYVTDGNGAMKESKFTLDVSNFKTLTIGEHYGPANTVVFSRQPQEDNVYLKADDIADGEEVEVKLRQPLIAEGTDDERAVWLAAILEAVKGTQYQCYSLESFGIGYMNFGDVFTIKAFARDGLALDYDSPEEYQTVFMRSDMLINGDVKESTKLEMPVATSIDYSAATTESEKRMLEAYMKVDKQLGEIISVVSDPKTGLETRVSQNAEAISAHTKKIETIEKAGYITESAAQSLINASAKSIELSVTQNLKIGTRNILLDSACFGLFTAKGYYANIITEMSAENTSYPSGRVKMISMIPTANGKDYIGVRYYDTDIIGEADIITKIKVGQTYTLSFWLSDYEIPTGETRTLSKSELIAAGTAATVTYSDNSELLITDKPQKFAVTFTISGTISKFVLLFARNLQENDLVASFRLSSLKLEEGNVATDWTPSVQDIEQTVEAKLELCVQTDADGNLQSAIHAKANQITIESDYFTLDAEGRITATSGNIGGWEISSDGLSSSIVKTYPQMAEEDANTIVQLSVDATQWTQENLEKYDLNGDGILNGTDTMMAIQLYSEYDKFKNETGIVQINPQSFDETILITHNSPFYGYAETKIGARFIVVPSIKCESIKTESINLTAGIGATAVSGTSYAWLAVNVETGKVMIVGG